MPCPNSPIINTTTKPTSGNLPSGQSTTQGRNYAFVLTALGLIELCIYNQPSEFREMWIYTPSGSKPTKKVFLIVEHPDSCLYPFKSKVLHLNIYLGNAKPLKKKKFGISLCLLKHTLHKYFKCFNSLQGEALFWLRPWHVEVPGPGIEPMTQP